MIDPEANRFLVTHIDGATCLYSASGACLGLRTAREVAELVAGGMTHAHLQAEPTQCSFAHAENLAMAEAELAAFEALCARRAAR